MAERQLNILIRVRDFFTAPFKKLGDATKSAKAPLDDLSKSGERTAGVFSRLGSAIASRFVVTLGDAERVLRGIVGVFGSAITAASEQEAATARLNEALRQTGQFAPGVSKAIHDLASELQRETVFTDEAILNAAQLGLQFGKLSASQIPAFTKAVIGLASAKKIDLASAATIVSKAVAGNTAALTRFGIEIDSTKTGVALFAEIMRVLGPLFGQATVDANTFAGGLTRIKNQIGEQLETIGNAVIKNKELGAAFGELAKIVADPAFANGIASIVTNLINLGVAAAKITTLGFKAILGEEATGAKAAALALEAHAVASKKSADESGRLGPAIDSATDALKRQTTAASAPVPTSPLVQFFKDLPGLALGGFQTLSRDFNEGLRQFVDGADKIAGGAGKKLFDTLFAPFEKVPEITGPGSNALRELEQAFITAAKTGGAAVLTLEEGFRKLSNAAKSASTSGGDFAKEFASALGSFEITTSASLERVTDAFVRFESIETLKGRLETIRGLVANQVLDTVELTRAENLFASAVQGSTANLVDLVNAGNEFAAEFTSSANESKIALEGVGVKAREVGATLGSSVESGAARARAAVQTIIQAFQAAEAAGARVGDRINIGGGGSRLFPRAGETIRVNGRLVTFNPGLVTGSGFGLNIDANLNL